MNLSNLTKIKILTSSEGRGKSEQLLRGLNMKIKKNATLLLKNEMDQSTKIAQRTVKLSEDSLTKIQSACHDCRKIRNRIEKLNKMPFIKIF